MEWRRKKEIEYEKRANCIINFQWNVNFISVLKYALQLEIRINLNFILRKCYFCVVSFFVQFIQFLVFVLYAIAVAQHVIELIDV